MICGKDFEYNQQKYLLISLEIRTASNSSHYQLVIFKLSVSRVICAFETPSKVSDLDMSTNLAI